MYNTTWFREKVLKWCPTSKNELNKIYRRQVLDLLEECNLARDD